MEQKRLIVLCGIPASGKSTYFENLVSNGEKYVHWSRDAIVEKIAKSHSATYDYVYNHFQSEIDFTLKTMLQMIRHNKPNLVVCDKTNLYSHVRDREFIFFRENGYHITYVFFEIPKTDEEIKIWKKRLESREGKIIPQQVLEKMLWAYCDYVPMDAKVIPDEIIRIRNWE